MKTLSPVLLRQRSEALREPEWLTEARLQAFATYEKLDAPKYRRTDLRGVDLPALALAAFLDEAPSRAPTPLAGEGVVHMPLSEAAREHESLVRPFLAAGLDPLATKWDALHHATWTQGQFLHVEKNVTVDEVVALRTELGAQGGIVRDVLSLAPLAKANVVDRWTGGATQGGALAMNAVETHLQAGSHLHLSTLQELGNATTLFSTRRALIGRDARLDWIDGQFGSGRAVIVNESILTEQGAKVGFLGAFFGDKDQHFDITTSALHRARHTESQLNMKGALSEGGYAANYSIVFIAENAPASSGHQHQETLILGEGAHADAIPKLDVETNDVSASHGASVGQVDPDQVFYLRTRGLDELQAKRIIVEGFFEPLLHAIPFEDIRVEIGRALVARLQ